VEAVGERIIVREDAERDRSDGGVFIPPTARAEENTGTVVSVGSKVKEVKPGDRVLYTKYNGMEITRHVDDDHAGETVVLREEELVAIILDDE